MVKHKHETSGVVKNSAGTEVEVDDTHELVVKGVFKSIVQTPGAATRNELSILLLSLYPKWTGKRYIKNSIKGTTQPLDDAINELLELRHVVSILGFFYRLSPLGIKEAKNVAKRHAKAMEVCPEYSEAE